MRKNYCFCSFLQFSNVDRILIYLYTADYKDKIATVFLSWNSGQMSSFFQDEDKKMHAKLENMFLVYEWRNLFIKAFIMLTDKNEKNAMGWACGAYGWGEGVYRVLVGNPEGKRPLGRPRRRWVDNIRMDLQEAGCGYMDWIGMAQDRDSWCTLVSAVKNLGVPWNAGNFLTSWKPVSCSRRTLHHAVSK